MEGANEVTDKIIDRALGNLREERPMIHPDDVIRTVCDYYSVKPTQLRGTRRDALFVKPRQICMFLLKEDLKITLVEIGNLLGGRDHTTIMHGVDKIREQKETNPTLSQELTAIKTMLNETN